MRPGGLSSVIVTFVAGPASSSASCTIDTCTYSASAGALPLSTGLHAPMTHPRPQGIVMVFRLNAVEAGLVLSHLVSLVFVLSVSLFVAPLEVPLHDALGLLPSLRTGVFSAPSGAVPLRVGGPALGETRGMLSRETPERLIDVMTGPGIFDVVRALEYEDAGALMFTEAGPVVPKTSPIDSGWL